MAGQIDDGIGHASALWSTMIVAAGFRVLGGLRVGWWGSSVRGRWKPMALATFGKGEQSFDQRVVLINRTAKENP